MNQNLIMNNENNGLDDVYPRGYRGPHQPEESCMYIVHCTNKAATTWTFFLSQKHLSILTADDEDQLSPEVKKVALKLSADLKALQYNGHLADVVFEFEDRTSVKAHKAILAARSPVFAEMFFKKEASDEGSDDQKVSKGEEGLTHVTISETISDVFQNMLMYIYAGEISTWKLEMIGAEMLAAAEKVSSI